MSQHATATNDQAKAEAFANQIFDTLNKGAVTLMLSLGHRTGLFDTLKGMPAATSEQIASAAGLTERYVREWLGAMVTGHIVDYDSENGTYTLPPEHARFLTRAAGPNNLANMAQLIPMLGGVEESVYASFREGGGVDYSEFHRFHQIMAELSAATFDATLIESTLPLVPGLTDRLKSGLEVVDIGCGAGHAIILMARAFPNSRFAGFDFSEEAIESANREAAALGLTNVSFEVRNVAELDVENRYDFITAFDSIHDQASPGRVLEGIARALKNDGVFLMVDIAASSNVGENLTHPIAPFVYAVSCMHCMTVSLALNGEGLGAMWGEEKARQMLGNAGFNRVEVKRVEGDILNNFYIALKNEQL
jgi:ubiquinone/menaquinone biosynthesis C-methylase UbiE